MRDPLAVCRSWQGTPYRANVASKGIGCDCLSFVMRAFEEIAELARSDLPVSPVENGKRLFNRDLIRFVIDTLPLRPPRAKDNTPMMVLVARDPIHMGIVLPLGDPVLWQCTRPGGMVQASLYSHKPRNRLYAWDFRH